MPAKPVAKRCKDCKRRKIKCDEAWPSCTPCARSGLLCSGPPNRSKFVHSGYSTPSPLAAAAQEVIEASWQPKVRGEVSHNVAASLAGRRSRATAGTLSRPNLTTHADRVASRLVRNLEHGPSRALLWSTGWLEWMPARFEKSPALRDAVTVFLSSWLNLHKELPMEQYVDPALHGKALRSLQRAVNDPVDQLTCETLAAATMVERVETLFCAHRRLKNVHTTGIQALMKNRGPPSLDDVLDVLLALENQYILMVPWILEGGENFYLTPRWWDAINAALTSDVDPSAQYAEMHRFALYEVHWVTLVREMKEVGDNREAALALYNRITRLASELESASQPVFERVHKSGLLVVTKEPLALTGEKYVVGDYFVFRFVGFYAQFTTVLNRMMKSLANVLGYPDTGLDAANRDCCRHMWMLIPYLQTLGPLGSHLSTLNIMLSWTGGDAVERDFIVEHLIAVAGRMNNLPSDKAGMEELIRRVLRAYTGVQTE